MKKIRLLLVEDDPVIARFMPFQVKRYGAEIIAVVSSGAAAVEKSRELKPDLILMDIRLEGEMNGISAAEKIRETQDIPILFVTSHATDEMLEQAKITDPLGYLPKPFSERELGQAIELTFHRHNQAETQELLKNLSGLVVICHSCHKIRDENGNWITPENFARTHKSTEAEIKLCPHCSR